MNYDDGSLSSSPFETLSILLSRCFHGSRTKVKYYINIVREKQVSVARVIGLVRSLSVASNADAFITEALDRALFQEECIDQLSTLLNVSEEDALQGYFNLKACGYTEGSILAYLRSHCSLPLEVLSSQIQIIVEKILSESSSIFIMVLYMFHFDHDTIKSIGQEMAALNICLPTMVDKLMFLNPTTDRQEVRDLISAVIQSKRASDSILADFFLNAPSASSSLLLSSREEHTKMLQPDSYRPMGQLVGQSLTEVSNTSQADIRRTANAESPPLSDISILPRATRINETFHTLDGAKATDVAEGDGSGENIHKRLRYTSRRSDTRTAAASHHQPSTRLSGSSRSIVHDGFGDGTRKMPMRNESVDNSAGSDDIISVDDDNDELQGAPAVSAKARSLPAQSHARRCVPSSSHTISLSSSSSSSLLSPSAKRFKRYGIESEQNVKYKPPRLPMRHVTSDAALDDAINDGSNNNNSKHHSGSSGESIPANKLLNESSESSIRPDKYIERFDFDTGAVLDSFASINEALLTTGAPYYALIQDLQNGTDGTYGWRYVYRSKSGDFNVYADLCESSESVVTALTTAPESRGLLEKAPRSHEYFSKSKCPCIRQLTTSYKQHVSEENNDGEDRDALDVLLVACRKLHRTCTSALFEVGIAEQALLAASAAGNSTALAWLLEIPSQSHRLDVNNVDSQGRSALLLACEAGYIDCVCCLLVAGADASLTDYAGRSPSSVAKNEAILLALRYCQGGAGSGDAERKENGGVVTDTGDVDLRLVADVASASLTHDNRERAENTAHTTVAETITARAVIYTTGSSKELPVPVAEEGQDSVEVLSWKKSKFEGDTDSESTLAAATSAVCVADDDSGDRSNKRNRGRGGSSDSSVRDTSSSCGNGHRPSSSSAADSCATTDTGTAAAGPVALLSKADRAAEARERSVAPRRCLRPR